MSNPDKTSLSDFDVPETVKGLQVFPCPYKVDKMCVGAPCHREWIREEHHGSLQVFYYDKDRVKKKFFFFKVKEYHIVKRALHHEGRCRLLGPDVWSLVREVEADFWIEDKTQDIKNPHTFVKVEEES